MGYVKNNESMIGKKVLLTECKTSLAGYFEKGSIVTITDISDRGYTFSDSEGNRIIEAGFDGFRLIRGNHEI